MRLDIPEPNLVQQELKPTEISAETIEMIGKQILPGMLLKVDEVKIDMPTYQKCLKNREENWKFKVPPIPMDRSIKDEPVAIVGYGPSLNQTWHRLKDFRGPIWSTSKAHDFLIQRGIKPTIHLDLDPHGHKSGFLTKPQPDVEYWVSDHVDLGYVPKLRAAGIEPKMYHVIIDKNEARGGYPGVQVRFDVGLTAAELAYQQGYRKQEWFGIEYGCPDRKSHAGEHGGPGSKAPQTQIQLPSGIYRTNVMFMHGLMLAEKMMQQRGYLSVVIHGSGNLLYQFLTERKRIPHRAGSPRIINMP